MKNRTHVLLWEIFSEYAKSGIFIALVSFAFLIFRESSGDFWLAHILLVLPGWFYFLRHSTRSFVLFFLGHLAGFAVILLPYAAGLGLYGILVSGLSVLAMAIRSFILRFQEKEGNYTVGHALAYCAILAIVWFINEGVLKSTAQGAGTILCIQASLFLFYFFLDFHRRNVDETLKNRSDMLSAPVDKLRSANARNIAAFLGFAVLGVTLALIFHFEQFILLLGKVFLWILRMLLELLVRLFSGRFQETGVSDAEAVHLQPLLPEGSEPAAFWEILEKILVVLLIAAAAVLAVYGIYRLCKWFAGRDVSHVKADEFEEVRTYIESSRARSGHKVSLVERLRPDRRQKIRRKYKKMLKDPMKTGEQVRPSDSPSEILEKLPDESLAALTPLYEKARYSREEITAEDMERFAAIR